WQVSSKTSSMCSVSICDMRCTPWRSITSSFSCSSAASAPASSSPTTARKMAAFSGPESDGLALPLESSVAMVSLLSVGAVGAGDARLGRVLLQPHADQAHAHVVIIVRDLRQLFLARIGADGDLLRRRRH